MRGITHTFVICAGLLLAGCSGGDGEVAGGGGPTSATCADDDITCMATAGLASVNLTTADLAFLKDVDPSKIAVASTLTVRSLEADLPELAIHESGAEKAEAAARSEITGQVQAREARAMQAISQKSALATGGGAGGMDWSLVGVAGGLNLDIGKSMGGRSANGSSTSGGATVGLEMGGSEAGDGTVSGYTTVDIKVDSNGATLDGQFSLKVEGKSCPDSAGKVPFKINVDHGAQGAMGTKKAGYKEELAITGAAYVNDAAYIEKIDVNVRVQKSVQRPDSHNAFVDYSYIMSTLGEWSPDGNLSSDIKVSRDYRRGSTTTKDDAVSMLSEGSDHAIKIYTAYLYYLQLGWRDGKCVEVVANVPDKVATGSSTSIEAKVRQKIENVELHAPIDAALEGGASLTPAHVVAAPGTFTYVAPDKADNLATLTFTSTSRRGIGKLSAGVRTRNSSGYTVDWNEGGNHVWGTICNGLDNPFTLNFDSGGYIIGSFGFTPSGLTGGTVGETGGLSGASVAYSGSGTYTVSGTSLTMSIPQQTGTITTPLGTQTVTLPGIGGTFELLPTSTCE